MLYTLTNTSSVKEEWKTIEEGNSGFSCDFFSNFERYNLFLSFLGVYILPLVLSKLVFIKL